MLKIWTDIASLHNLYTQAEITPTQVTNYYLERIARLNPLLNAFLTVTSNEALRAAADLDAALLKDKSILTNKPLFGVPLGLKDLYMTKGIKTTAGSKVLENYIADYDATVVSHYQETGAILLGKLNCDAWAHGSSGENSDFGPTRNPWNTEYVSGGSSSGSAVAVAADLCLVAGGTDTGGSIRCPASFCGVTGLKPTYGLVSRYGVISMASSLDTIGHLANTIEDIAQVLTTTAGHDPHDATSSFYPKTNYLAGLQDISMSKLRIGVPKEYQATDSEVSASISAAIQKFTELGATLVQISLPHTEQALACYYIIQPAEVSSNLARYDGIRYGQDRSHFGMEAKRRIVLGTYALSAGYYDAYYKTAQQVRSLVTQDFSSAFQKVDLIIGPVIPHLPFKLNEKVSDPLALYLEDVLTVPINLAGIPAISLPCGFSQSGLPIGVQLIGPKYSESKLFQAAHNFQLSTTWHHAKPPL